MSTTRRGYDWLICR